MLRSALPPIHRRGRVIAAGSLATLAAALLAPLPSTAADTGTEAPFHSRMTGRWTSYTDANRTTWDARSTTLGTLKSSTALEGKNIIGTDQDFLYQYSAVGVTGYSLPVPRQGSYEVRLHMAEGWWNAPGKRVFDVTAEGAAAASSIDIFAAVGKGAAHDVTFVVGVVDGTLDLGFIAKADLPVIGAIEVVEVPAPDLPEVTPPSPTPTTASPTSAPTASPTAAPTSEPTATPTGTHTSTPETPTDESPAPSPSTTGTPDATPTEDPEVVQQTYAFRMSASPVEVVDSAGHTWQRRGPALGSSKFNTSLIGKDVAGTTDDALYQRSVLGPVGMLVPVPSQPADYRVRLLFAEGYWPNPGQRVIDVRAEGAKVATGVDAVAAAGPKTAYDVVFDTHVSDGMLTVQFDKVADQPMVAGIEVVSTDPAAATGLPMASLIPHADTSEFRLDVSDAPTADNSEAAMARFRDSNDAGKGWNTGVNAYDYNSAFYRATPETPRRTVEFYNCQNKSYLPNGLYDGLKYFVDVPIPDDAVPASGTDAQLGIYDPTSDQLWEFWVTRRTPSGGWEACWGGRLDNVSTSHGAFPVPFGVSASGLAMAGGVVSIQEAARGRIDHALYLTVTEAQAELFSYPANRTDGRSDGPDLLREGQRLRLDPSVDVTTLGLTPFGEMVARTAQEYGFIVSDLAGHPAIATEAGRADQRRTGLNPWDVLLGGPSYDALRAFPWDKVTVLPVDHGKPEDPAPAPAGD